tara:strand:+ start:29926 stop:30459 length:534 start_codon:yes stop_codon:yes gene_type:complete
MAYNTTVNGIDFIFDFSMEEVCIGAATSRLDADSLQLASREAESSATGIVFPQIVNTSGKVTLDAESETGLNVVLQNNWTICTLKTSGLFTVTDGNVVSDINGVEIFSSNPDVDTQNNTSQAGVRVFASGGGSTDWSVSEREQIREALGIDGDKTTSTGGLLQKVDTKTNVKPSLPI